MVRGENQMLASALGGARPVVLSGDELTVEFPPGAEFFKRKAEQEDHRRAAADALRRVTGQPLALRFELGTDASAAAAAGRQAAAAPASSEDDLVRAFMEEFNAQELAQTQADDNEVDH
jgi:hypothetical protein